MNVVIVGAGIGGLTLAIALSRRGHDVRVLEQRRSFEDEGAGVVLGPNVMAALDVLGLAGSLQAAGQSVVAMNITDARGRVLGRSTYGAHDLPFPAVAIHRVRLHDILRDACAKPIRLGSRVSEVYPGRQPAVLVDGERLEADLIVGADGVRSAVRRAIAPGFGTRYCGATCFRFVIDGTFSTEVFEMWGRGKRIGVVPLGSGRTYVFLTLNGPARRPRPFDSPAELRAMWAEFGSPAREVLEALPDVARVLHNDLEDGLSPAFVGEGVALLGDAAHTVTPNMGQGAGLAVEDACCLASLLEGRPLPVALAEYERLRRPRATWILKQSYSLGRLAQLEGRFAGWLRNRLLRLTPDTVNARALRRIVTDMPGVPTRVSTPASATVQP